MDKVDARKRLLFQWVTLLVGGVILLGAFLAGTGNARPASLDGVNVIPLTLSVICVAVAIAAFRKWRRLSA